MNGEAIISVSAAEISHCQVSSNARICAAALEGIMGRGVLCTAAPLLYRKYGVRRECRSRGNRISRLCGSYATTEVEQCATR